MRFAHTSILLVLVSISSNPAPAVAQGSDETEAEESPKTIAELVADSDRFDSLFTLYRSRKTGETHLLVKSDQLGREYIYFAVSMDGVVQGGHFRGSFRDRIVSVRRHFDRIKFQFENPALRAGCLTCGTNSHRHMSIFNDFQRTFTDGYQTA